MAYKHVLYGVNRIFYMGQGSRTEEKIIAYFEEREDAEKYIEMLDECYCYDYDIVTCVL